MTQWLRQSTAVTIVLGPFVDDTDGKTAETALTLSQADIRLSKNGAAFAQVNESTSASHMENGNYSKALDTTDTNTLGRLRVHVNESGALPVWETYMVVPAHVWDAHFAATSWGEAIARGTLQSATSTTAVLASATSFADDLVIGATLVITGGTGAGQSRVITDWVNSTDTATVDTWTTTPDSTSTYAVYPTAPGSATLPMKADMVQISGDSTAADNAESFFDGTGYPGTGNTIPTVTSVTNRVTANADQIASSATAATNLSAGAVGVVTLTIGSSATTTSVPTNLTASTTDLYKDRWLVITSGTLAGTAKQITAYNGTTKALTVNTLPGSPANGVTAVIV